MKKMILKFALVLLVVGVNSVPIVRKNVRNDLPISDGLVRYKIFPLAAAAYSDKPEDCLRNRFKNAMVHTKVKHTCGDGYQEPEDCYGYTGILNDEKAIVVSFRGTRGFIQLLDEIDRTAFKDKVNTTAGGQVSNYFFSVYKEIFDNGLDQSLTELVSKYPTYDVWVTGHSLGGSLASIAASEMIALGKISADRVKLFTFGQPRTGDANYAAAHDKIVLTSYRVTHNHDIVPHLPYENFEGYYHHKSEIWYNNNMKVGSTYIECDEDESNSCSDGAFWKYSILDHLYYYNYFVTSYGVNGCA